jgi:tRNA dimethylallyltransferase
MTGPLPVFALTGPTGAGKSAWALRLAESAPVEIVSVDSALVYRGLDIGTAKPERAVRARIIHHLIDICEPTESYSAGRFVAEALECIRDIHARGRVPLLTGGTMLYLRALRDGLAVLPQAVPELRAAIDARAAREGWPVLHGELARLDPAAAGRISVHDSQRIQRALEVCYSAGRPISELQRDTQGSLGQFPLRLWILAPAERRILHEHLSERFAAMRSRADLTARHPAMRAVGYRQLWAHLDGAFGLEEAKQRAIAATRQLAKRQLTWMRREAEARWIDPGAQSITSWIRDICRELTVLGR